MFDRIIVGLCTVLAVAACSCSKDHSNPSASCRSAEDCAGNTCSFVGSCVEEGECADDDDCRSFERCNNHLCEPRPACDADDECGTGFFCSTSRRCLAEGTCEAHTDCVEGNRCSTSSHRCIEAGACVNDSDCDALQKCDEIGNCNDIVVCESDTIASQHIPANVLILLDRSCSMRGRIFRRGPRKWETAVGAVNRMLDRYAGVNWGLELFPEHRDARPQGNGQRSCDILNITVNIGDDNAPTIQNLLTGALDEHDLYYPAETCTTPIRSALYRAQSEPGFSIGGNAGYVIFLTDGMPTCSVQSDSPFVGKRPEDLVADLKTMGVDTFVIGFGDGDINPAILNEMADAGGRALAGETRYYFAEDDVTLDETFDAIASSITSCDFGIEAPLTDLANTYVLLNDVDTIDMGKDWDYDGVRGLISVKGEACERVKNGASLRVVQGCPGVNPE